MGEALITRRGGDGLNITGYKTVEYNGKPSNTATEFYIPQSGTLEAKKNYLVFTSTYRDDNYVSIAIVCDLEIRFFATTSSGHTLTMEGNRVKAYNAGSNGYYTYVYELY